MQHARAAGCEWLHVDFEDHLRPFYLGSCGFRPTNAGLIASSISPPAARQLAGFAWGALLAD